MSRTYIEEQNYIINRRFHGHRSPENVVIAKDIIEEILWDYMNEGPWRQYEATDRLAVPANITSGNSITVSVTSGAVDVTFDGSVSGMASGAMSGQWIGFPAMGRDMYLISSNTASGITLDASYPVRATVTSGDYNILPTVLNLPANMDTAVNYTLRLHNSLRRVTNGELRRQQMHDGFIGGTPDRYAQTENQITSARAVEITPGSTVATHIQMAYWRRPTIPSADTDILDVPDNHMLVLRAGFDSRALEHIDYGNPALRLAAVGKAEAKYKRLLKNLKGRDSMNKDARWMGRKSRGHGNHFDHIVDWL